MDRGAWRATVHGVTQNPDLAQTHKVSPISSFSLPVQSQPHTRTHTHTHTHTAKETGHLCILKADNSRASQDAGR